MSKITGINLGTTSNCIAVMEGGKPTVIASAEGIRTTPSVVASIKTGKRLIGGPARRQAVTNAGKTVSSIKRHMGMDYRVDIGGEKYAPQETSAMILQELKANAESYLGKTVTEAVIMVPAYFSDTQRQATKDASKITGLDVKRVINEPMAAALAYGFDNEKEQEIMVYDLGDSIFSVFIIEIGDGVIEVLSTNDDTRLGDDDFDDAITNWIISKFKKTEGMDLSGDKMALQRLREAAEKTKKELSTAITTNINPSFITATAEGPKHPDMNLTRAKPDELTHDLVKRTAIPVQNALKDAGIIASELGEMLLVSGPTRMIATREKIEQLTGEEPNESPNSDECVTIGTAIQGGKLAGDIGARNILLLDVTPPSLSIETIGGVITRLTERNTIIPTKKNQIFSTATGNQTVVDIHVVQGERQFARNNKTLGQFRLDGIPPARRGIPQTEATFDIDANGIVNVSARNLGIGREQHIVITSGSDTSDDDVGKTAKEAAEYKVQDRKHKEAIDTRNGTDSMVFQVEKASEEVGDKIAPGDKTEVEADPNSLKEAVNRVPAEEITGAWAEDIKASREKLASSIQKLFARAYKQAQASGAAGQAGPDMGDAENAAGGDDVADADFREV